jgi:hypothetical protein
MIIGLSGVMEYVYQLCRNVFQHALHLWACYSSAQDYKIDIFISHFSAEIFGFAHVPSQNSGYLRHPWISNLPALPAPQFITTQVIINAHHSRNFQLTWLCPMTDIDWACSQPIMSVYNASGSINFSGFNPPSDNAHSPGNWSIHTAIHNVENATANTSILYQTLWLDTSPPVALSSPQLPYTDCVIDISGGLLGTKAVSMGAMQTVAVTMYSP